MRISISSNTLKPGGAEMQRVHLANALSARGHDVQLSLLQEGGSLEALVSAGVAVRRFGGNIRAVLQRQHEDCLITGVTRSELAMAICYKGQTAGRGTWFAASHHSYPPQIGTSDLRYGPGIRQALRGADAVIALTAAHRQHLLSTTPASNIVVIANGVPIDTVLDASLPSSSGRLRVGFLGRITDQKGLAEFLSAWRKASIDAELHIWGDGPLAGDLRASTSSLRTVIWHGWVSGSEQVWPQIDVLVLPSKWEAQPMVLLEAVTRGIPVVCNEVGGVGDILEVAGTGQLVSPGVEDDWVDALRRLPSVVSELRSSALAALDRCRDAFAVDRMVDKYVSLIESHVSRRR